MRELGACSVSHFSASSAAMQPVPAAVTAWRNTLSCTSPAANTPGTDVRVLPGSVRDIAFAVQIELAREHRSVRRVPDGDEHAIHVQRGCLSVRRLRRRTPVTTAGVPPPVISSTTVSQMTSTFGCSNNRRCRIFSARSAVAPVDQRHPVGMVREVERFLDRGVAAADHGDRLAAVEEAVAGGAGRYAAALVGSFPTAGQASAPARRSR